jgi:hypothetical protein
MLIGSYRKKVIGLRLIEVKHTSLNITERVVVVVEEFGLIDKTFAIILDNASFNANAMENLTPMFVGYLGSNPSPEPLDPNKHKYNLVH